MIPTEAGMREKFAEYLGLRDKYNEATIAKGGTPKPPWSEDPEERYRLWCRRYARPAPPTNLSVPNIGRGLR